MATARDERELAQAAVRAAVRARPPRARAYDIGERVAIRDTATGGVCGRGRVADFICDDEGYAYVVEGEGPYRWQLFFSREPELERD